MGFAQAMQRRVAAAANYDGSMNSAAAAPNRRRRVAIMGIVARDCGNTEHTGEALALAWRRCGAPKPLLGLGPPIPGDVPERMRPE